MTRAFGALASAVSIALVWAICSVQPEAHKTVVSKFTYYQDVLPILASRCGACHVDGGVAPTLLTYDAAAAFPWAIQQALLSRRMPPWGADEGLAPIKGHQKLSVEELDTLMTWAAGSTPEGAPRSAPAINPPAQSWPAGPPDLVVPMPEPAVIGRDRLAIDHEVVVPLSAAAGKWIRFVDLRPGTRSIVRRAQFSLRPASGTETVVGQWLPGDVPQAIEAGAAFRVPDGASLVMRLHYQRPTGQTADAIEDRSVCGIYFADAKASRAIHTTVIGDDAPTPFGSSRVIAQPADRDGRIVAVRPVSGPDGATVRIVVVDAKGARTPMMRMRLSGDWPRRYALAAPIRLPRGSVVEITVTASQAPIWQTLTGDRPADPSEGGPLRIAIETVEP